MDNKKSNADLLRELRAYTKRKALGEDVSLSYEAIDLRKRLLAAYYAPWEGESLVDWLKRQPPGSTVTVTRRSDREKDE